MIFVIKPVIVLKKELDCEPINNIFFFENKKVLQRQSYRFSYQKNT